MKEPLHSSPQRDTASRLARWRSNHAEPAQESTLEDQSAEPSAFDRFLEAVRRQMQPEGRALHQAGMHQYLRTLLPPDVTLADLVAGWQVQAGERSDANTAVLSRRKTCAELAAIAAPLINGPGTLTGAVRTCKHGSMRPSGAPIPAWRRCVRPLHVNSRNCKLVSSRRRMHPVTSRISAQQP
ncbi:MAG TPA: hypothetical protein VKT82_18235 [Ktedonobacterales bacterium]|nr:hypothetical protein [Ktedonobacterales bacterium]